MSHPRYSKGFEDLPEISLHAEYDYPFIAFITLINNAVKNSQRSKS